MKQTYRFPAQAQAPDKDGDLLRRLYREIGVLAVSTALQVDPPAPRQRRVSAEKLMEERRDNNIAA